MTPRSYGVLRLLKCFANSQPIVERMRESKEQNEFEPGRRDNLFSFLSTYKTEPSCAKYLSFNGIRDLQVAPIDESPPQYELDQETSDEVRVNDEDMENNDRQEDERSEKGVEDGEDDREPGENKENQDQQEDIVDRTERREGNIEDEDEEVDKNEQNDEVEEVEKGSLLCVLKFHNV